MTDEKVIKKLQELLETMCNDGDLQTAATVGNALDLINRQQQENRQLHVKLDDCERDIIPKLKYSLERANKYGAETEAENIRLLKENENLTSDLTSAKAEFERLKGNASKLFISDKTPSRYFKVKSSQPILIYPYEEAKIELVPSTEQTKAEAIKAFAERLHKEFSQCQREYRNVLNSDGACAMIIAKNVVNNLVKEMIGEKE